MRRVLFALIAVVASCMTATFQSAAQNAEAAVDATAPSYDMKAQALADLEAIQKKFADLATAIPADKFTWRPADSRSFSEVFLHVAGERYGILGLMGAATPPGIDRKALEKSTTDKARIVEELNKSWEFTQTTIKGMINADFAKPLPKLGPQANAGDVVYILVADAHEHLGQLIAYARVNGIVPPWTAAAKKQAAEKQAQQDDKQAAQK